nr:MAG TPA: hypothetical protein [Caudoviricetes sp.]
MIIVRLIYFIIWTQNPLDFYLRGVLRNKTCKKICT